MNKESCETLIFGATFYGISRLIKDPASCIIVERTYLTGSEYVDSFNEREGKKVDIKSNFCLEYSEQLSRHGLIDEQGNIYQAPALFLLCEFLKQVDFKIMYATEVVEIEKKGQGYSVTVFNGEGITVINADKIIDTTPTGVLGCESANADVQKSLNLVIEKTLPKQAAGAESVVYNPLSRTFVYSFPVPQQDDFTKAREKLIKFWRDEIHKKWGCRIVLAANTFAYKMPNLSREKGRGYLWVPSCGFDNLLHAIDEGQVSAL